MSEKVDQLVQIGMRVPESLLARADKLAEAMSQPGLKLTRTEVLRLATFRGIEQLEAERGKKSR